MVPRFDVNNLNDINDAIAHFNQALDDIDNDCKSVNVARTLFDSLNKIQTTYIKESDATSNFPFPGERVSFQNMIGDYLSIEQKRIIVLSEYFKNFVLFSPDIMDHNKLRNEKYDPNNIEPKIRDKASNVHRSVKRLYKDLLLNSKDENYSRLLLKASHLLYIIRSNIAHGEKTPFGPDYKKKMRDETIAKTIVPLLVLIFKAVIGCADNFFISYGTLSPGKVNNEIISNIEGDWIKGIIKGEIVEYSGLSFFTWKTHEQPLEINIFHSKKLIEKWEMINEFEGSMYKRRLIPAILPDKSIIIGNIYFHNEQEI